jgi:hypothetical protein
MDCRKNEFITRNELACTQRLFAVSRKWMSRLMIPLGAVAFY